jgi:threonine/homoserine/homoserine lactone efflux protein
MTLEIWLTFVLASTALLVLPGPTILLVLSYALTQGRRVAIASALGVATGDLLAMSLSMIGLGALLLTSAFAFAVLKWLGAAYLLWLGLRMLRNAGNASPLLDKPRGETPLKVYRDLATVTALNPKSNTFFVAFVPQFLTADAAFAPQATILIATFVTIACLNALVFALAANHMRGLITRPRALTWLTRAGGTTLIAMALLTATLRRHS